MRLRCTTCCVTFSAPSELVPSDKSTLSKPLHRRAASCALTAGRAAPPQNAAANERPRSDQPTGNRTRYQLFPDKHAYYGGPQLFARVRRKLIRQCAQKKGRRGAGNLVDPQGGDFGGGTVSRSCRSVGGLVFALPAKTWPLADRNSLLPTRSKSKDDAKTEC